MKQPAISVLMPAYNVQDYIQEAIDSLQAQTFKDIEIVVVNDGSTDNTFIILQRIAKLDSRIRVIDAARRAGIVAALNLGLTQCRAPYIARMDGDDLAVPDRLEKQLAYLAAHPDIALVGSAMSTIDLYGQTVGIMNAAQVPTSQEAISRTLLLGPPCGHIWLARREVYESLNGYRDIAPAEDYDFLLRAVTSGYCLGNIPEPLMKIRIRPGNTFDTVGLRQRKTQRHVIKLYKERVRMGRDSFTPEAVKRFASENKFESAMHGLAVACMRRAFSTGSNVTGKFFLLALASILSPWQARYFWNRARQRLILKLAASS